MISRSPELPRAMTLALAAALALVLGWRIIATGIDAVRESGEVALPAAASAPAPKGPDAGWRLRLARNPADYAALLNLALQLERDGNADAAQGAMAEALQLAPTDQVVLLQGAFLYLRTGDEESGLSLLRRLAEVNGADAGKVWPVFAAGLDVARHAAFFSRAARENPRWWPQFIQYACERASVSGILHVFGERVAAGSTTTEERRCVIARLQREGQWASAYRVWLDSLPAAQKQSVDLVFNGGFETPISNLGFDWIVPSQEGTVVSADLTDGASGRRALRVTFVNKRYSGPPLYEYLLLGPGKYRFDGRGRADSLSSWLGVQWGLYCREADGRDGRQLARSDPLASSADWAYFHEDFVVATDCPVQVLRLEPANPQRNANSPGNAAVRLRGSVWFDDLRVSPID